MIALADRRFGAVKQHFNLPEGFIRIQKMYTLSSKTDVKRLQGFQI